MKIQGYGPYLKTNAQPQGMAAEKPQKGAFAEKLKAYTAQVNHDVKAASKQAEKLAITGEGNMSETMIAMKQADLSFQLMLAARNKMMDAYREVMRMQV